MKLMIAALAAVLDLSGCVGGSSASGTGAATRDVPSNTSSRAAAKDYWSWLYDAAKTDRKDTERDTGAQGNTELVVQVTVRPAR